MRGLVIEAGSLTFREDLPRPPALAGETRVSVILAGVCATDLALAAGYMDFAGVPGHEFVGRALDGPLAGRRVVGEINAGCGTCPRCLGGDPRHCPKRTVLGILGRSGAFAEELVLPTVNLLPVPDDVPDEAAVFTEPLAAALQLTTQLQLSPGLPVLVAGDGRLGLLCAHALAAAGARVSVAGRHPERARLLPAGSDFRKGLLEADSPAPDEAPFAAAVEATGHPEVLARLSPWVVPGGTLVLKTTSERAVPLDLAAFVVREQILLGSRCGRFGPALDLLVQGQLPLAGFVHGRFPLEQGTRAFEQAGRPGVLKVLLQI